MAQIKYNRLIALGCSHTYGHGLPDCFIPPDAAGVIASKLAWPNHLAKLMNIDSVINLGWPGCSNKYILHSALNFEFNQNDLVVALWTFNDRTGIFQNSTEYDQIAWWDYTKYSRKYMKNYYNQYDSDFQNTVYINYFYLYAKQKGLNYYYSCLERNSTVYKNMFLDDKFVDLDFQKHRKKYKTALDGSHMGVEGHLNWAKEWCQFIKEPTCQD
jgi:hypothetical protein